MPATPAWPPESSIRLFVDTPLSNGTTLTIEGSQAHYLINVMRMKAGAHLKLFDDISGEWLGTVTIVRKRQIAVQLVAHLRPREAVPDLWLGVAPIRRARFDLVAEKACELGVARFTPVLTRRGVVAGVSGDRLRAQMIEAAEQCGRTALPLIDGEQRLTDWLAMLGDRTLFFADEAGGVPAADAFAQAPGPAALLVGPEGGFDDTERTLIEAGANAVRISLGPRILRAETAAIAGISAWMAIVGDWHEGQRQ